MPRKTLSRLRLRRRPGRPTQGWLIAGQAALPVALGRTGIKANKREGDGATPRGSFHLTRLWWRADRHPRPPLCCRRAASDRTTAGARIRAIVATTGRSS